VATSRSCYRYDVGVSSSSSTASALRMIRVSMEVDALPPLPTGSRIGPEDFVDETALPHILKQIEENNRWDADIAA
jgi:hypothetical protein